MILWVSNRTIIELSTTKISLANSLKRTHSGNFTVRCDNFESNNFGCDGVTTGWIDASSFGSTISFGSATRFRFRFLAFLNYFCWLPNRSECLEGWWGYVPGYGSYAFRMDQKPRRKQRITRYQYVSRSINGPLCRDWWMLSYFTHLKPNFKCEFDPPEESMQSRLFAPVIALLSQIILSYRNLVRWRFHWRICLFPAIERERDRQNVITFDTLMSRL